MQRVDHPDPAAANVEALHDLANGATGLALVFAGSIGAYGYGLDASEAAVARVLDGVHLDAGIAIELDLSPQSKEAGARLAALLKTRGIAPPAADIRFGYDPVGAAAAAGASPLPWRELEPFFIRAVSERASEGFRGPFAAADGRVVHNAGGSEAEELAFVLAVAVTYLRALGASGIALETVRQMIFFRMTADADQFLTLAKLRALRKLWARVEEASGLAPKPAFVSADTAWRMMTKRDPHVNMLRATVAAFSAGLGGADAITVLPFTLPLGLPDRLARRIARNTQLILIEESNLAKVADPAAGSGGIEDLTEKLCRAAWSLFQEIERAGGAWSALEQGLIQNKVAAVRVERERALASGHEALTGTTVFPNAAEVPVKVLDVARPAPVKPPADTIKFEALAPMRLAEPFE
jgi:methylmalonyl-CoA mutase